MWCSSLRTIASRYSTVNGHLIIRRVLYRKHTASFKRKLYVRLRVYFHAVALSRQYAFVGIGIRYSISIKQSINGYKFCCWESVAGNDGKNRSRKFSVTSSTIERAYRNKSRKKTTFNHINDNTKVLSTFFLCTKYLNSAPHTIYKL